MPRSFVSSATHHGPTLIGVGLAVVLASQLFAGIPIAAAMGIIAWGSMLTLRARHKNEILISLNLVAYLSIIALAMLAEFESRRDISTLADMFLASALSLRCILCLSGPPVS